jgi:hypothetical protein
MLRQEAVNITLTFTRTSDSTGRISWNIPSPAAGCAAGTQAFCGMVLTLDTTPADSSKTPKNGTVYQSDPTGDSQLFAGDKIGTSLVVGGFYQDTTTTSMDVTGLKPNTPYYVSGFPTDCQFNYYPAGVHAYSQNYTNDRDPASSSKQVAIVSKPDGSTSLLPNDYTGLVAGIQYKFNTIVGMGDSVSQPHIPLTPDMCVRYPKQYPITIDGQYAQTYQELIDQINQQFGIATGAPQSPFPPNTGVFYWTGSLLYSWDGYVLTKLDAYVQANDPSVVALATYWYDTSTHTLKVWDGFAWQPVTVINYATDPTTPLCDATYWYNGTTVRLWNGVSWSDVISNVQLDDPSLPATIPCGSYWYNSQTQLMYKWDDVLELWVNTIAVASLIDPNALPMGYLWFNTTSNKLYTLNTPVLGWNELINLRISTTPPMSPATGTYWYQPATKLLSLNTGTAMSPVWVQQTNFISHPTDPTVRSINTVWWNTTTQVINVWDAANNIWAQSLSFFNQNTDPTSQPVIAEGMVWLNPVTLEMVVWVNGCWKSVTFINYALDPQSPTNGTVWFNGTTWKVYNAGTWVLITPTHSSMSLQTIPAGSFWYNTLNSTLNMFNGATWVNLFFSTISPVPKQGDRWYDQTAKQLKQWNGTQWILASGVALAEINCHGFLMFTDLHQGSDSFVAVSGSLGYNSNGRAVWQPEISSPDETLWQSLDGSIKFLAPAAGSDAIPGTPMYETLGVGTDGSADERNALATEIRYQLGYPTVAVEITQQQMDTFITLGIRLLRQRTAAAYTRGFFFMQIRGEVQKYKLSGIPSGYNKIANVLGVYRTTSAFLSSAHGAGVYGQIILQNLYNMGTFDMLSYHIMSDYIENLEILFASRVTFTFNEQSRELHLHHRFPYSEQQVLIECAAERSEQDILQDRWLRPWMQKYVLGQSQLALAETRGKFASLPGAGGNITLNASDMRQAGNDNITSCMEDIENYIADRPEEFGSDTSVILG